MSGASLPLLRLALFLTAVLSAGLTSVAAAGESSACAAEVKERLSPGQSVTLVPVAGERIEGKYLGLDAERAAIRLKLYYAGKSRFEEREVPLDGLHRIEYSRSSMKGVVLGAVMLGALGAVFGEGVSHMDDRAGADERRTQYTLAGAGLGVLVGAGIGAMLAHQSGSTEMIECAAPRWGGVAGAPSGRGR